MTDLFTADSILLVLELQCSRSDTVHVVRVIQRCVRGAVNAAVDGEVDVSELERLGARLFGGGVSVFGWSEQPEEADDDEVSDDLVVGPPLGVVEAEGVVELAEDRGVGGVGPVFGGVFADQSPFEISEYGPELAVSLLSGIWLTQVGDPLRHGTQCRSHCVSADRVVGEAVAAVVDGEDEEVGDSSFGIRDITEGWVGPDLLAEGAPVPEGPAPSLVGFAGDGCARELQSSIEVSVVLVSGGRWSSRQGVGCGYCCSKWARKRGSVRCCRREASSAMTLTSPGR